MAAGTIPAGKPAGQTALADTEQLVGNIVINSAKQAAKEESASMMKSISEKIPSGRNFKFFVISLILGGLLFIAALLSILSVSNFTFFFTLGSICFLSAAAFLNGPKEYFKRVFRQEKRVFTIIYFCSLIFSLFATLGTDSFILALLSCVI